MRPLGFIQVQTPKAKGEWMNCKLSSEDCAIEILQSTHLRQNWNRSRLPRFPCPVTEAGGRGSREGSGRGGAWGAHTDPVRAHSRRPAPRPRQGSEAPSLSPLTCPCKSPAENPSKCSVDTKCFLLTAQLCISESHSTAPFGGENGLDRTAEAYLLPRSPF